jgi:hypothetical protein
VDLGQQERRVVRKEEAEEFGRLNGLKYFETSAVRLSSHSSIIIYRSVAVRPLSSKPWNYL